MVLLAQSSEREEEERSLMTFQVSLEFASFLPSFLLSFLHLVFSHFPAYQTLIVGNRPNHDNISTRSPTHRNCIEWTLHPSGRSVVFLWLTFISTRNTFVLRLFPCGGEKTLEERRVDLVMIKPPRGFLLHCYGRFFVSSSFGRFVGVMLLIRSVPTKVSWLFN